MRQFFIVALVGLALSACSSDKAPAAPTAAAQPAPRAAEKTLFDTQIKALDKAKGVQDIVNKQKQATDKKLDDSGG